MPLPLSAASIGIITMTSLFLSNCHIDKHDRAHKLISKVLTGNIHNLRWKFHTSTACHEAEI